MRYFILTIVVFTFIVSVATVAGHAKNKATTAVVSTK